MKYQLKKALKNRSGSAALEAILCLIFMFAAFYTMWGAALLIYNKSKLDTATQFAAHSASIIMDRAAYRGINPKNVSRDASELANIVAINIYRENTCGMLPDQFTGQLPNTDCGQPWNRGSSNFRLTIRCGPETPLVRTGVGSFENNSSTGQCYNGNYVNARVMQIRAEASVISPFTFLVPTGNSSDTQKNNILQNLSSDSKVYSAGGG
jgi:hypothetical protein